MQDSTPTIHVNISAIKTNKTRVQVVGGLVTVSEACALVDDLKRITESRIRIAEFDVIITTPRASSDGKFVIHRPELYEEFTYALEHDSNYADFLALCIHARIEPAES